MTSVTRVDPLDEEPSVGATWASTNIAEALPGVPTPLSWTFWREPLNRSGWFTNVELGATTWREREDVERSGSRLIAMIAGRPVANVDLTRLLVNRVPGLDADALCEQVFDLPRPDPPTPRSRERWPIVAARAPVALIRLDRRLRRAADDAETFWRQTTALPSTDPLATLADAHDRFTHSLGLHVLEGALAQGCFERVVTLVERAKWTGTVAELVTGQGGLPETDVATDLWQLGQGQLTLDEVLDRHGYHAPDAGELSTRSWREEPDRLGALAASALGGPDPRALAQRQVEVRRRAERELLAGLSRRESVGAALALRSARWLIPLREVGKNAFLRLLDVARFASRAVGEDLARRGVLVDPDDVFFLTLDELSDPPVDARDVVEWRRARRIEHLARELPAVFTGRPPDGGSVDTDAGTGPGPVRGQGVCGGVVEGTARVVLDMGDRTAPLGGDEVLLARTTDPSGVAVFMGAAALVVDVGGPMSHAAIVARELGIPCVVGTGDGTRRVPDGARVRVDGRTGTVEVVG